MCSTSRLNEEDLGPLNSEFETIHASVIKEIRRTQKNDGVYGGQQSWRLRLVRTGRYYADDLAHMKLGMSIKHIQDDLLNDDLVLLPSTTVFFPPRSNRRLTADQAHLALVVK